MTEPFLRLRSCLNKIECIWVFIKCLKKCRGEMVSAWAFDECMMHCGCIYLTYPRAGWSCEDYGKLNIDGEI